MIISKRLLLISAIVLSVATLIFAFGYVNSLVSYKYEVQDTLMSNKPLNDRQEDIVGLISSSKIEAFISLALLIIVLLTMMIEPQFKGKVTYVK